MNETEAFPHHPGADAFDVRASLRRIANACLAHKLLIALTWAFTVGLVVAYLVLWPPIYQAKVMLMSEQEEDRSRDQFYDLWGVFRKDDVASEAAIATAAPVLERVVTSLGLTYDDVHHPFLRYAGYLWSESWVGKRYRKVKEYFFPPQKTQFDPTPEQIELARTIDDFGTGVELQPIADTNVGNLFVRGPSPRVAQIANALVDAYLDERKSRHLREATRAYEALDAEVEKAQQEVQAIEDRQEEYYDENSLLLEFEKDKVEITRWLQLEAAIVEEESTTVGMEKSLAEVERQLAAEEREVVGNRVLAQNQLREAMKSHKFTLDAGLQAALLQYQPDSREVADLRESIEGVEQMIAGELEKIEQSSTLLLSGTYEALRQQQQALWSGLAGACAKLEVKQQASRELKAQIDRIPEKMRTAHDLGREQSILQKKYMILLEKKTMTEIFLTSADTAPQSMHVVAYAQPPARPIWPKKKLLLALAGLLGLGAGIGLAVLMDALHGRVTSDRLSHVEAGVPIYATLALGVGRGGAAGASRLLWPAGDGNGKRRGAARK